MNKLLAAAALCAISTVASAKTGGHRSAANLARMNLTPTNIPARKIPVRSFMRDTVPTSFHYDLPATGAGAVFGYKPFVDTHPIQGYEVNQATAEGFGQPSSSVGAALAYRF